MAKRKSIRTAGRLVSGVIYSVAHPKDNEMQRSEKTSVSSSAREKINLRYSWQKLELVLAANFSYLDLHVILTYDDAHLPERRTDAVKNLKKFIRQLRTERKEKTGEALLYVYVTEGNHGSKRYHHHMVLNATGKDFQQIADLWQYGHVDYEKIGDVGYTKLAHYLTKEPRDGIWAEVGERTWTPSLGLLHPIPDTGWVPDNYTLAAPPGAIILLSESKQNEFGEYTYIKYLLPEVRPDWPKRHRRAKGKSQ